jgi:shikimate kinase
MALKYVFIGPPGSGKSSTGRALARTLRLDFADTDALIEKRQGKTVGQIFVEDGEAQFRALEESICVSSLQNLSGVLSLGGGAVLSVPVQKALENCGAEIIFLDVNLSVAAPRIGFNRDRPLLLSNPRQQWQKLMDARRPIYEGLATLRIETLNHSVTEVVKEILSKVSHS